MRDRRAPVHGSIVGNVYGSCSYTFIAQITCHCAWANVISFDANLIKRIAELFALVNGSADAGIAVQQFAHEYRETVGATKSIEWHRGIVENRSPLLSFPLVFINLFEEIYILL